MSRCPAGSSEGSTPAVRVPASPEPGDLPMSKAVDEMVVHHPDSLHVRVDNRRTYEGKTAALEILAHGVRLDGVSGNLPYSSPTILKWATVDEAPLICVEASKLRLDFEKRLGVLDCRFDLRSV